MASVRAGQRAALRLPRAAALCLGKARHLSSSSAPFAKPGFFELRTDEVLPGMMGKYMDVHNSSSTERKALFPGWLGIWKTELGGSVHNVHHIYHWNDYDQRDRLRATVFDHPMWFGNEDGPMQGGGADQDNLLPLPTLRHKLSSSQSVVMLEATDALHACGLVGAAGFEEAHPFAAAPSSGGVPQVVYELRRYQLVLGYPTVPRFLDLYTAGLQDKLKADDTGASQLVTLLYSDCGPLNVVIELWRHESMQRAQDSRVASRKAAKWKEAIGEIAQLTTSFSTSFMRPLRASPWQ